MIDLKVITFIHTHSLVIIPLGPVGMACLGSRPWVSRIFLAAGLKRSLDKEARARLSNNFSIKCHAYGLQHGSYWFK